MATTAVGMVADATDQIENVPPREVFDETTAGEVVLLDVREPVEWERHIAGAIQVPRGILEFVADPVSHRHRPELDPKSRVIVYCRSGARSSLATLTLQALGYENAGNLEGGINAWQEAGLPVVEHHEGI